MFPQVRPSGYKRPNRLERQPPLDTLTNGDPGWMLLNSRSYLRNALPDQGISCLVIPGRDAGPEHTVPAYTLDVPEKIQVESAVKRLSEKFHNIDQASWLCKGKHRSKTESSSSAVEVDTVFMSLVVAFLRSTPKHDTRIRVLTDSRTLTSDTPLPGWNSVERLSQDCPPDQGCQSIFCVASRFSASCDRRQSGRRMLLHSSHPRCLHRIGPE